MGAKKMTGDQNNAIIQIYKKGNCKNYDGITLLSVSHKIISCMVYNCLEKETVIRNYQNGFRRNRSRIKIYLQCDRAWSII